MADTGMSSELYEDVNDLLSKIKNDRFQSNGITVGIGLEKFLKGLSSVNVGVSWSEDSSFLNKLSKYNEKVLKHNAHVSHSSIIYTEHVLP